MINDNNPMGNGEKRHSEIERRNFMLYLSAHRHIIKI